jgi:hypothetical protein
MAQFPLSNLLDGTKTLATKIYNATGELFTSSNPAHVQLSGSEMELYSDTISDRPSVNSVAKGTTFTLINANFDTWISDGVEWKEV